MRAAVAATLLLAGCAEPGHAPTLREACAYIGVNCSGVLVPPIKFDSALERHGLDGAYEDGRFRVLVNPSLRGAPELPLTIGHEYIHYLQYVFDMPGDTCSWERQAFAFEEWYAEELGLTEFLYTWEEAKVHYEGCD